MNIEYANAIPLRTIFVKMGFKPINKTKDQLIYNCPFRKEHDPNIVVDVMTNTWIDNFDGTNGNVVTLVGLYLEFCNESHTIVDILRWLTNMVGYVILEAPQIFQNQLPTNNGYAYKDHQHLCCPILIRYVEKERGIPFKYAQHQLLQISIRNRTTGNTFTALGIKNEDGGYAIESQYLKAELGRKYISFIRGRIIKPEGIHIFKDVFDYLSAITNRDGRQFDEDVMILNSYANMPVSAGFIRGYGYKAAYTWLDNTPLGQEATKNYAAFFRSEPNLTHKSMNSFYRDHPDLNCWLVAQRRN